MTGRDFVEFATKLSDGVSAIEYRTAIGRAYYGVFHVALELLMDAGVRLPKGPESHQKMRLCLIQSQEAQAVKAGEKMESLRKFRNLADYDLSEKDVEKQSTSRAMLRRAREVVEALDQCRQEPVRSRMQIRARDYAARVLRLPVS